MVRSDRISRVTGAGPLRGRQSEALRNDRIVLEAARKVFAEHGVHAPMTAVAEEGGVGIGTLYRRYGGKQELLQHLCVLSLEQNLNAADAALATEGAWEGLRDYIQRCVDFGAGAFSPVAGTIVATAEMRQLARAVRRRVDQLVSRAQHEGSLRSDVNAIDILRLVEHFSRPGGSASHPSVTLARQLAIAVSGLRSGSVVALPGPAPTPKDYEAVWR
jgi:AcrR family transcriptional regulator